MEMPILRTTFREQGIQLPARFVADGGTKDGSALIDTASYNSLISTTMATDAGVTPLGKTQQVSLSSGSTPHLPLHGPVTITLGSSFMTVRFSSIIVGEGDWDLLVGRDVLSKYMGLCWNPHDEEVLMTALTRNVSIN